MEPAANIPPRFHPAYRHIQRLAQYDRYQGELIFGSLARGEATDASDMDVKVVTDEDNPCSRLTWRVFWMDNKHASWLCCAFITETYQYLQVDYSPSTHS